MLNCKFKLKIFSKNTTYLKNERTKNPKLFPMKQPYVSSELTKELIESLEAKLIEAIRKNDLEFLEHIIHKDLLFLAPNGETITKEMDLKSHRSGEMVVDHLDVKIEELRIVEDSAVVVLHYNTKGRMLGQLFEGNFRYIRIWKNTEEGPKVLAGSCHQLL